MSRVGKAAAIYLSSVKPWFENDAIFAWWAAQNTDTNSITTVRGGTLTRKSAAAATLVTKALDMTSANYSSYTATTGMSAPIDTSLPFMVALTMDKHNQASTAFPVLVKFGSASTDVIQFQTNASVQPRFQLTLNGATVLSPITKTTWTAGTLEVHWIYVNPADATNTIRAGVNTTTTTSGGVVSIAARSINGTVSYGNAENTTSGLSLCYHGMAQVVANRSGANALTFAQSQTIVQSMMLAGT